MQQSQTQMDPRYLNQSIDTMNLNVSSAFPSHQKQLKNVQRQSSYAPPQSGYPQSMLKPKIKGRACNECEAVQKYETSDGRKGNNILVRSPTHRTLSSIHSYINSPLSRNSESPIHAQVDQRNTRKLLDKNNPRDVIEFSPKTQMFKRGKVMGAQKSDRSWRDKGCSKCSKCTRKSSKRFKVPKLDLS